jgi:formate transporter
MSTPPPQPGPHPPIFGFDAFTPKEIAAKIEQNGVVKAKLPFLPMAMLGAVAGAFIGLGALYYTLVVSDPDLTFAMARVLGGVTFSLGLMLVIIGGAELFTGNNFLVMAWLEKKITTGDVARNWVVVFLSNGVGAIGLALIVYLSHQPDMNAGKVALAAVRTASYKASLPFSAAFFKGILCNLLVCLGVWVAMAGRSVIDKIVALTFPVSAFVACGFEHCIANMYFIPLGIFLAQSGTLPPGVDVSALTWGALVHNLIPVTLGNIVGGSVLVAFVYYSIYRKSLRT